jgi:hypothetical protein
LNISDECAIQLHGTKSHKVKSEEIAKLWVIPPGEPKPKTKNKSFP